MKCSVCSGRVSSMSGAGGEDGFSNGTCSPECARAFYATEAVKGIYVELDNLNQTLRVVLQDLVTVTQSS